MNAFNRILARLRGPAGLADHAPAGDRPGQPPIELQLAHDKRRLERILRDHGLTRAQAASAARDYFRDTSR